MWEKASHFEAKKQRKSIRDVVQALDMASTIGWNALKKDKNIIYCMFNLTDNFHRVGLKVLQKEKNTFEEDLL